MSQTLPHESPPLPDLAAPLSRLDSLDLLRGIAILGIFLMNTWNMSMPQDAYVNPAAYSPDWVYGKGFPIDGLEDQYVSSQPLTGLNYAVYVVVHLFADMKFITIFSIMFGAGIVLQSERATAKGRNPWVVHYLRMAVLLLFGLLHAYGLWYGDILAAYAICGMVLAPCRLLPATVLLLLGIAFIGGVTFIDFATFHHWHLPPLQYLNDLGYKLYHGGIDRELDAYRGGWWHQIITHRAWESLRAQTADFLIWTFLRCGGCILIGMALQKRRFFHAAWPRDAYATIATIAIPVGWVITFLGVQFNDAHGWSDDTNNYLSLWHLGVQFNYWGSLLTALGYISFGTLLAIWAAEPARRILRSALVPIRSIGRTALSNYIFQTIVGTTLFYGHGFGLYGYLSRAQLLPIVLATWIAQLIFSTVWLRYFRQGPLEWLWHAIVYWRFSPTTGVASA